MFKLIFNVPLSIQNAIDIEFEALARYLINKNALTSKPSTPKRFPFMTLIVMQEEIKEKTIFPLNYSSVLIEFQIIEYMDDYVISYSLPEETLKKFSNTRNIFKIILCYVH